MEKANKELSVRIVELETKAIANAPRPMASKRLESRIEELTTRLNQEEKEKSETLRLHRTADKTARDMSFRLQESDRHRLRLEEELKGYEEKVQALRQKQTELVN